MMNSYNKKLKKKHQLCEQKQKKDIQENYVMWNSSIEEENTADENTRKKFLEQIKTLRQQHKDLKQANADDEQTCTSYKIFTYVVFFFILVICIIYAIYRYRTVETGYSSNLTGFFYYKQENNDT